MTEEYKKTARLARPSWPARCKRNSHPPREELWESWGAEED